MEREILARPPAPGIWHLPARRTQLTRGRAVGVTRCGHKQLCSYWPRRRTIFAQGRYTLQHQAGRRTLARQCRSLGFIQVGYATWFDSSAGCVYQPLYEEL